MGETFKVGSGRAAEKPMTTTSVPEDRVTSWRQEIADCYRKMRAFNDVDPTYVFQSLSQFSGRASEIRSLLSEHEGRREANFRIKVIDPFIEECDRQFKVHSRLQAIREMDARLAGGAFT